MTRFMDWVENNRSLALMLLFLFSVVVRIMTLEYLDLGGDNAERWMQAHRIAEGLGVTHWYNHSMRWVIVLPLAGLIKLFGPHPAVSAILPILFSSIGAVFIYLIGERLQGPRLGLSSALLTVLLPLMARSGSQLWPGVFEMAYIAIMVWLILCWIETRSTSTLVLAGIVFFLGWGARVTMIYSYPGAVMLIWLPTRNFRAVLIFTAVAAGLCFAEWGWFWWDSGNPKGRLGLLFASSYGNQNDLFIPLKKYLMQFSDLIKIKGLLPVAILTFGAGLFAFREKDKRLWGIAALYFIGVFLMLYMVSSILPIKLAMPFGSRKWPIYSPYGILLLMWFLLKLKDRRPRIGVALISILFAAFTIFSIMKIPPTNTLIQVSRDYAILKPTLDADQPIRMVYEPWQPNFIEKVLIEVFTGEKKRRNRKDKEINLDMRRNQQRIASLFLSDVNRFKEYHDRPLVRVDKYVYILPSTNGNAEQPAAESVFGTRNHAAYPITR
ncbi:MULTISPECIES: glycosyltransferase family 39 protein [unclassified Pseudodesulfovibrio]|uniref:ArnT family glycosyltransferase n=1 Tax=unclassified Pseudodesulfovibrio TaxID=2661612 RepID=UPI0013E40000|nr:MULTISPECIES: glycosyltransferase family 39 protein [unclassified Pseudodesulfovibrio]MCJ2164148.1 glycosyltransferase family 39 protein [Pseudodesulfovibrio sp. S3-i]